MCEIGASESVSESVVVVRAGVDKRCARSFDKYRLVSVDSQGSTDSIFLMLILGLVVVVVQ